MRERIPLSVKFKRNSAKCLSVLEPLKLRKDSETQVLNGKILSFGRRMDEISLGGVESLHDCQIWRRNMNVNPLIPSDFAGPTNWAYSSYRR